MTRMIWAHPRATSIGLGGHVVDIAEDGTFDVPEHLVEHAKKHGAKAAPAPAEKPKAPASKPVPQWSNDDLRAKAANTNATNDNQETVEQPAADTRPTRDQFDDPDAYDEALAGWAEREGVRKAEAKAQTERAEAEKAAQEASEKAEQEAAAAAAVELNARWTTRVERFKEIHDDFEAVTTADDVSISPIMANGILRLENGPEVAYHLGQNKDEAARIAKLDPMTQLIEIGALSKQLRTPAQRGPRPRPLEPIDAASNVADSSDREETMEEVAARVNARYARERKPFVQVTTR